MRPILMLALAILTISQLQAQRQTPVFGTLTAAERSMTTYERDPEAAAVILFDIADAYFVDKPEGDYDIRFTRMKRTKIFKRAGFDQATVIIPYYVESLDKMEKVVSIEAITYDLRDGLMYKKALEAGSIFDEQLSKRVRAKKFTFPDVQEGCIIEFRYVIESPFLELPDWSFQSSIPTKYSEYTVSMIPFYEYIFIAQGLTKFDYQYLDKSTKMRSWGEVPEGRVSKSTGINFYDLVSTYAMIDVPAFNDESYITSREDYIMKMDFQLAKFNRPVGGSQTILTTWPELKKELRSHTSFGKYLSSAQRLCKRILEEDLILDAGLSADKKCELIMDYMRTNFRWDEYLGKLATKSPKDFLQQKNGNSADINLFLTGMLRAAGITADPVLISTRQHGKIKFDYPFEHYFDDVIVLVSNKRLFLMDATETLLAYDRIPERCINEKGLVVSEDENEVKWISLDPRAPSIDDKNLTWTVNPETLTATVAGRISASEYEAFDYRQHFGKDTTRVKSFFNEAYGLEVSSISILNADQPRLPYVMTFRGKTIVERLESKLIVQPFARFPFQTNPLRQQVRSYPVDFVYPQNSKMKASVVIPDGYVAEAIPEPVTLDNELVRIIFKVTPMGKSVEIQADYFLKKASYEPSEYENLRSYFGIIAKAFNTPILLVPN